MTWKLDCGSYTLFVIEDGFYWRDPETYYADSTDRDWRFHPRNDKGQARLNFGCFLITNGDQTIMIDAGIGDAVSQEGMTAGLMPRAVDALGIARDSVEMVVYTHMHYDHIGGSQTGGKLVFPNARHVFHVKEWEHWRMANNDVGKVAQRIMGNLFDAGVVDFVDTDSEVLPGVTAVESFGHTPGHLSVSIISDGTRTLIGGDVSNHPFQVEHPRWSLPVDNDAEQAATTRDRIFEQIKDSDTTFLAAHYPMPGVGKIVTEDGVRVYQPESLPKAQPSREGTWVVTAYLSDDTMVTPAEGSEASLVIEGNLIAGTMGVNRFSGQITDDLPIGPIATTRMAGPEELMRQEATLLEHLQTADRFDADEKGMILHRDGLVLVELERSGTT